MLIFSDSESTVQFIYCTTQIKESLAEKVILLKKSYLILSSSMEELAHLDFNSWVRTNLYGCKAQSLSQNLPGCFGLRQWQLLRNLWNIQQHLAERQQCFHYYFQQFFLMWQKLKIFNTLMNSEHTSTIISPTRWQKLRKSSNWRTKLRDL